MPGRRGKIILDENAYSGLVEDIRKQTNWEIVSIPPSDRGLSDSELLTKHAQGRWPVFTKDTTMHTHNPARGASAFVVHEQALPEQFDDYKVKVTSFFKSKTNTTVAGKIWKIPVDGDVTSEDLS